MRIVTINITYQYCPERLKLKLSLFPEVVKPEYVLSGLNSCEYWNCGWGLALEVAACSATDHILTMKLPFTFRILCCFTENICLSHASVEKCPFKGVYILTVLKQLWAAALPIPRYCVILCSRPCFPKALILETAARGSVTSHETVLPFLIESVPLNKCWHVMYAWELYFYF